MVALSRLFIDKIALTIPVQSRSLQHDITEHLRACADARIVRGVPYGDPVARYHFAYTIPLYGGRSALVQVAPRDDRMNFLRFEFNPSNRGPAHEHPLLLVSGIICGAWPSFARALDQARINRLDFAIDIYGIHIDRLGIHHPTRSTFSSHYERDGHTTGMYLGKRTSKRYVVIYDKTRQARERHARILRGERTRVEIRAADMGPLSALSDMPNPFASVALFVYPLHSEEAYGYAHFLDSCRYRGAQAALHLIRNRRTRAQYRAWLTERCGPSWWSPEEIWAQRMDALRRALGG
ncbi:MAG: hypothetical protein E2576_24110 [Alcaligenaceae bacterium]|nr:hypothetical protein [Alcaligenaceae bacterium SAGV5]MPS54693.1 hypothetical protein [Alcaligenaceae bacterium SAGV3]MPT59821.1 hypothetical protein [Alcaligenaceae bacterium]